MSWGGVTEAATEADGGGKAGTYGWYAYSSYP